MSQILITEDSGFQRTILKRILQNAGYTPMEAISGREALRKIEEHQPRLILLDLLMPDIDGFQVLKVLKSKHNTIPVVVVTADVQDTTRDECLNLGVAQVLNKPVDEHKLLEVIDGILNPEKGSVE